MLPRCILSTPANRPERFHKAKEIGTDAVMLDLEDGVGLSQKEVARKGIVDFFSSFKRTDNKFKWCLRINSIRTTEGLKDLLMLKHHSIQPDFLILPKVEHPEEIQIMQEIMGKTPIAPIIASIESGKGLQNANSIAICHGVSGMIFGGGDLASDLGCSMEYETMLYARSRVVQACAIAGITPMDVPFLKIGEEYLHELSDETENVKQLGFKGKLAIHPSHVSIIQDKFYPEPHEIQYAHKVLSAFEEAGEDVCVVDGKMIDYALIRNCQRVMDIVNTLNQ
ncbi:MAG: CoA ester lyase [Hyphomicrobiales bacterium]